VADGSLAEVTQLRNRAVTLATESANGTVSDTQRGAIQTEYAAINAEINSIGSSTNYNGTAVFTATPTSIFLSDGVSNTTIGVTTTALSTTNIGLAAGTINTSSPVVQATGTVSIIGQPNAGDTVDVNGTTFTFRAAGGVAAAGDVAIGPTTDQTVLNLAHAINHSGGVNGTGAGADYDTAAAVAGVAASVSGNVLTITATAVGALGNTVTLTNPVDTSNNIILAGNTGAGSTLTNGVNAGAVVPVAVTNTLDTAANAQATLGLINSAVATVAGLRGTIGAGVNRLQAASAVITTQVQNLTSAEDGIVAANIPAVVANLSKYSILDQSGISALAQANTAQQTILTLLR
jgi:flagellin